MCVFVCVGLPACLCVSVLLSMCTCSPYVIAPPPFRSTLAFLPARVVAGSPVLVTLTGHLLNPGDSYGFALLRPNDSTTPAALAQLCVANGSTPVPVVLPQPWLPPTAANGTINSTVNGSQVCLANGAGKGADTHVQTYAKAQAQTQTHKGTKRRGQAQGESPVP